MTRRPTPARHRSLRLRATAPATALTLLALTACQTTEETEDPRPVSSADAFFSAVESLEAVESVDRADAAEPSANPDDAPDDGETGEGPADDVVAEAGPPPEPAPVCVPDTPVSTSIDPTRSRVLLADDADSVELRVAERDLRRLYDDFQYPDGPPEITIMSGDFSVEAPRMDHSRSTQGDKVGTAASPLNLPQLPHLAALPDVEAGVLEDSRATVRLAEGADLRDWVLENADSPGDVRLTATTASAGVDDEASSGCGGDSGDGADAEADPASEPTTTSFSFSLGADDAEDRARTLFETADAGGATLLMGSVGDRTSQHIDSGDLHVPRTADVADLHAALVAAYGSYEQSGFSVRTAGGPRIDFSDGTATIKDVLEAVEMLTEVGARPRTVEMNRGGVDLVVDDADGLRAALGVVTDAEWPLPEDDSVEVGHVDHGHDSARFTAEEWQSRGELIASLWDAGFTALRTSGQIRGTDFGLTVTEVAGPDVTRAAGRDALVAALREGGWHGDATITVAHGDDNLTFRSTATGRSDRAYNGREGSDAPPPQWGEKFLTAWNATAS